jgi:hypothetical protein
MKKSTLAVTLFTLTLAGSAAAQKACSKAEEANAQKAIDRVSTFATLNATWKSFRHCDSGAIGEQFTDAVLRLVVDWKGVNQLADQMKDPEYNTFILNHLKSPEAKPDAPDVYSRAKANCPKGLENWCKDIADAVKEPPAANKGPDPLLPTPTALPPMRTPQPGVPTPNATSPPVEKK